ncbi:MAG: amidase family protein, partial [Archaeoglobaceae archaeon]
NLAGLPALNIPLGFIKGLPVGMQVIGNYFEESKLISFAKKLEAK